MSFDAVQHMQLKKEREKKKTIGTLEKCEIIFSFLLCIYQSEDFYHNYFVGIKLPLVIV
jgi:hypothetical protein